uniref:Uncharacterized protein n=1 Tax=Setaria viridis TaxID=4556 RepID=A0A4U6SRJ1_SETVI|nr:hypothetical protein SEVIR_9G093950v2 [Setaria viridis]
MSSRRSNSCMKGESLNVDAHNLARSSLYLQAGRHVWLLEPPEGVCKSYSVTA